LWVKINYAVGDYVKYVIGELIKEDDVWVVVRDPKQGIVEVKQSTIIEFIRYDKKPDLLGGGSE